MTRDREYGLIKALRTAVPEETVGELSMPAITRTTLCRYSGASGDHNPIHIDTDFARAAGMDDVFAQGMLVMAYLGNLLVKIAPIGNHRHFSCRFRNITQLGDRITCTATLTGHATVKGERQARLALVASNQHGDVKLSGEALVAVSGSDHSNPDPSLSHQ